MPRTRYNELTPQAKAQSDFMHGGGLADNPYQKESHPMEWWEYAMHMHELQAREFIADISKQAREIMKQHHTQRNEDGWRSGSTDNTRSDDDGKEPF